MRAGLDRILAIGGLVIMMAQAMVMTETQSQAALVVFGLVLNQMGYWGAARRLMPNRRVFLALRAEVDSFIGLVRILNGQAIEGNVRGIDQTRTEMVESIDKICMAAGVIGETIPPERIAANKAKRQAANSGANPSGEPAETAAGG